MTDYAVYLEVGAAGECMAHLLDLPGCFARAKSGKSIRDAAQCDPRVSRLVARA